MFTPEELLERSDTAAHILAHARRLKQLGACFAAAVPFGLARQARVVNYRAGVVVIHADNGAAATKLRQLSARLKDDFLKNGFECNQIALKVQPVQNVAPPAPPISRPISSASMASLAACAAAMPEASPLAQALRHLQNRARIK
jgi:hypothetical protein